MWIARIRRWQWILISLVVGYGMVAVQQLGDNAALTAYPESMADQRQFETALVTRYAGVPHFTDVVVYPEEIDVGGGAKKRVHVVVGRYYEGRGTPKPGERIVWNPRAFVADVPYQPCAEWGKPVNPGKTVLDFLESQHRQRGVAYSYAWWRAPRWRTAVWMGGSLVVLGLIWPTIVNLLVFGRFVRPAEERGPSLREVIGAVVAPAAVVAEPEARDEGMGEVEAMAERLEKQLGAGAVESAAEVVEEPVKGEPVKQLMGSKDEVQAVVDQREEKAFGAGEDDYYPTERRGKKVEPKP